MKKMVKQYSFNIGETERSAIVFIRRNDINVSKFLRYALRNLQQILQKKYNKVNDDYVNIKIKDKNDLEKYKFLLEDLKKLKGTNQIIKYRKSSGCQKEN